MVKLPKLSRFNHGLYSELNRRLLGSGTDVGTTFRGKDGYIRFRRVGGRRRKFWAILWERVNPHGDVEERRLFRNK